MFYVDRGPGAPAPDTWDQRVDDFNDWARAVETRGEMVLAETIPPGAATAWVDADEPAIAPPHGQPTAGDGGLDLAGLCVVRARDLASARELARRAPPLGPGARTGIRALHPE